ncbi:VOC family protein [Nocardioides sp. S5]|uniref:VOC family protein n=1 Tax=Nocardioides sp. S5 TaxID=2017486 RepID=UPI001A8E3737|nr:VOC family protein [Nocardioides sp. S5]
MSDVPRLLHTVLDAVDVRAEAEFWRGLLGLTYRPGDEAPDGSDDADWLVLVDEAGGRGLAVQEVEALTPTRWPEPGHPSVSHLDTTVATRLELDTAHERVLGLGGELRLDRTDDPDEPLRAYASPAGHVFCVFVAPPPADMPRRALTGTCAFRLMPTDDLVAAPSTLAVGAAAGGAQLLTYTWLHPDDGEQAGSLLLGAPAADGAVSAAWTDTWHQRDLTLLTGATRGSVTTVGYDYAPGWRWEIDVVLDAPTVGMVMRNVVPEGQDDQDGPAGPYDVIRARWT